MSELISINKMQSRLDQRHVLPVTLLVLVTGRSWLMIVEMQKFGVIRARMLAIGQKSYDHFRGENKFLYF
jgi:hypothetical protein